MTSVIKFTMTYVTLCFKLIINSFIIISSSISSEGVDVREEAS